MTVNRRTTQTVVDPNVLRTLSNVIIGSVILQYDNTQHKMVAQVQYPGTDPSGLLYIFTRNRNEKYQTNRNELDMNKLNIAADGIFQVEVISAIARERSKPIRLINGNTVFYQTQDDGNIQTAQQRRRLVINKPNSISSSVSMSDSNLLRDNAIRSSKNLRRSGRRNDVVQTSIDWNKPQDQLGVNVNHTQVTTYLSRFPHVNSSNLVDDDILDHKSPFKVVKPANSTGRVILNGKQQDNYLNNYEAPRKRTVKKKQTKDKNKQGPVYEDLISVYYQQVVNDMELPYEISIRFNYIYNEEPLFLLINQYKYNEYKVSETYIHQKQDKNIFTLKFSFSASDVGSFMHLFIDCDGQQFCLPLTIKPVVPHGPFKESIQTMLNTPVAQIDAIIINPVNGLPSPVVLEKRNKDLVLTCEGSILYDFTNSLQYIQVIKPSQLQHFPEHWSTIQSVAACNSMMKFADILVIEQCDNYRINNKQHNLNSYAPDDLGYDLEQSGFFFQSEFFEDVAKEDQSNEISNERSNYLIFRVNAKPEIITCQCCDDKDLFYLMLMQVSDKLFSKSEIEETYERFINAHQTKLEHDKQLIDIPNDYHDIIKDVTTMNARLSQELNIPIQQHTTKYGEQIHAIIAGYRCGQPVVCSDIHTDNMLGDAFVFCNLKIFVGDFMHSQVLADFPMNLEPPDYHYSNVLTINASIMETNGEESQVKIKIEQNCITITGKKHNIDSTPLRSFDFAAFIPGYVMMNTFDMNSPDPIWDIWMETPDWYKFIDTVSI